MKTKETPRVSAVITSSTLGVNVFIAPGKVMIYERPTFRRIARPD
jgi:hypothetical protein